MQLEMRVDIFEKFECKIMKWYSLKHFLIKFIRNFSKINFTKIPSSCFDIRGSTYKQKIVYSCLLVALQQKSTRSFRIFPRESLLHLSTVQLSKASERIVHGQSARYHNLQVASPVTYSSVIRASPDPPAKCRLQSARRRNYNRRLQAGRYWIALFKRVSRPAR